MFAKSKIPPVEERNESFMHKLAKEKLAEWLHTEDNYVVEEYPIVQDHCGTWNSNWVSVGAVGEEVKGGWKTGKTYKELVENPLTAWDHPNNPVYPVAICDVFTYYAGKIPEAKEIWEVRHTHGVTPAKIKAVLECYSSYRYSGTNCEVSPHFFEVDAQVILGFDAKIKPKDALRKLRLSLKDLNPKAQLTEKQWKAQFEEEDKRELEERFKESDEYKQYCLHQKTLRQAKKDELEQAVKTLNMKEFLTELFKPDMMKKYHEAYEKNKDLPPSPVVSAIERTDSSHSVNLTTSKSYWPSPKPPASYRNVNQWADWILDLHLSSMLPRCDISSVRKAWMEKNDTNGIIIYDSD
jgi:hypothetical protein